MQTRRAAATSPVVLPTGPTATPAPVKPTLTREQLYDAERSLRANGGIERGLNLAFRQGPYVSFEIVFRGMDVALGNDRFVIFAGLEDWRTGKRHYNVQVTVQRDGSLVGFTTAEQLRSWLRSPEGQEALHEGVAGNDCCATDFNAIVQRSDGTFLVDAARHSVEEPVAYATLIFDAQGACLGRSDEKMEIVDVRKRVHSNLEHLWNAARPDDLTLRERISESFFTTFGIKPRIGHVEGRDDGRYEASLYLDVPVGISQHRMFLVEADGVTVVPSRIYRDDDDGYGGCMRLEALG